MVGNWGWVGWNDGVGDFCGDIGGWRIGYRWKRRK